MRSYILSFVRASEAGRAIAVSATSFVEADIVNDSFVGRSATLTTMVSNARHVALRHTGPHEAPATPGKFLISQ
jgi:hypothetical protein